MHKHSRNLSSEKSAPLVLAYIAFPLGDMAQRAAGLSPFRSWIDAAWLLLSFICLCKLILTMGSPLRLPRLPFAAWVVFPIVTALAFISFGRGPIVTYMLDLKSSVYVLLACIWVVAFGIPSKRSFVQAGLALSMLIAAEFVIGSAIQQVPVRPVGSGEVNYDACLIVLSLCVALSDPDFTEKEIFLLFLGVLVTFSRTGAITALAVLLLSRRVPIFLKLGATVGSLTVSILSFLIRDLQLDLSRVDRYLMWTSAIELFHSSPAGLIWGYGIGSPLPAISSAGLADLWSSQSEKLDISGVYAFEYHSFWLRLLISWGSIVTAFVLITLFKWIVQRKVPLARFLGVVILLEGLSMGVIYLSNVGVPILLLILLAEEEMHGQTVSTALGTKSHPILVPSLRPFIQMGNAR